MSEVKGEVEIDPVLAAKKQSYRDMQRLVTEQIAELVKLRKLLAVLENDNQFQGFTIPEVEIQAKIDTLKTSTDERKKVITDKLEAVRAKNEPARL